MFLFLNSCQNLEDRKYTFVLAGLVLTLAWICFLVWVKPFLVRFQKDKIIHCNYKAILKFSDSQILSIRKMFILEDERKKNALSKLHQFAQKFHVSLVQLNKVHETDKGVVDEKTTYQIDAPFYRSFNFLSEISKIPVILSDVVFEKKLIKSSDYILTQFTMHIFQNE